MSSNVAAGAIDHHHDPSTSTGIPNKKLIMWAFLASDCMFFGTLISTHLIYRLHPGVDSPDPRAVFDLELTSFSTFILLMSSLMMALAVSTIQKGYLRSFRRYTLVTIFFGLIFLACQVYEFSHFVHEKEMTLSNSIFGSTFFVLTGTHGTHVAIGVLWLAMMYVRSFKPVDAAKHGGAWLLKNVFHVLVFAAASVLSMFAMMGLVHASEAAEGFGPAALASFGQHSWPVILGLVASLALLVRLDRQKGAVEFDERHAVDVEMMGLYWHFVDIVWIVIFTAVYLLEYVFPAGPI
jgi:cytochrome o ubiquinol oxidase subunit III